MAVTGFGTDAAGLEAFQSSGNTLGDLGSTYIGQWFSLLIIFTATVASSAGASSTYSPATKSVLRAGTSAWTTLNTAPS